MKKFKKLYQQFIYVLNYNIIIFLKFLIVDIINYFFFFLEKETLILVFKEYKFLKHEILKHLIILKMGLN